MVCVMVWENAQIKANVSVLTDQLKINIIFMIRQLLKLDVQNRVILIMLLLTIFVMVKELVVNKGYVLVIKGDFIFDRC